MSFILYCIFPRFELPHDSAITGVGNHPVEVLTWGNLGMAISAIRPRELTPDVSRVAAYEKVVEAFFKHRPVLPLRYGNIAERKEDAAAFLERGHAQYEKILGELNGCVEMGIRILLPGRQPAAAAKVETEKDTMGNDSRRAGAAYLSSRRAHYEMEDIHREETKEKVECFLGAFSGLFKKSKVEDPRVSSMSWLMVRTQGLVLSLYFLVPEKSLEKFYERFRELDSKETEKILLSGPWPPYNFTELS